MIAVEAIRSPIRFHALADGDKRGIDVYKCRTVNKETTRLTASPCMRFGEMCRSGLLIAGLFCGVQCMLVRSKDVAEWGDRWQQSPDWSPSPS